MRFKGKQTKAAQVAGLTQPTLSLLLSGRQKSITEETLHRLLSLALKKDHARFWSAFISPEGDHALSAYEDWLTLRERRLLTNAVLSRRRDDESPAFLVSSLDRREERRHLLLKLAELCPSQVRAFLRRLEAWGFGHSPRAGLALSAVIEPLLESASSGRIERGWQDLTRKEFIAFVEAGLVREQILLTRSPDLIRAQEAGRRANEEFSIDRAVDPRAFYQRAGGELVSLLTFLRLVEERVDGASDEDVRALVIPMGDDPALQ